LATETLPPVISSRDLAKNNITIGSVITKVPIIAELILKIFATGKKNAIRNII
jgi:hypothetical protein